MSIRLGLIVPIPVLALAATSAAIATQTSVQLNSQGGCSTNTVIMQPITSTGAPGKQPNSNNLATDRSSVPSGSEAAQPCYNFSFSHTLNALDRAQLRVVEWEHRLQVSASRLFLDYRLGEQTASLWVDLSNDSPYDAYEVRSDKFGGVKRTKGHQVFRKPSDPEVIFIESKGAPLPGKSHVILQMADAKALRLWESNVTDDYCLYDVSTRARDESIEGYASIPIGVDGDSFLQYRYRSVPVVYLVSMKDMFGETLSIQIPAFLRFAPRATERIFYPSRMNYGNFQCWPI